MMTNVIRFSGINSHVGASNRCPAANMWNHCGGKVHLGPEMPDMRSK